MDAIETIKSRRSIRKYKDTQISKTLIQELIDYACYAPSSHNRQPWSFTVIHDQDKLNNISTDIRNWYNSFVKLGTPLSFIKEIKKSVDEMKKRVKSDKDLFFYHAPAVIIIHAPKKKFYSQDCACASQNIMLAARASNIGSCWIGFADIVFNRSLKLKKRLNIPATHKIYATIALGYPEKFPEKALPRKQPMVDWL